MKKFFKWFLIIASVICVVAVFVSGMFIFSNVISNKNNPEETTQAVTEAQSKENQEYRSDKFYYNQLSDTEKKAYDRIIEKIYDMPDEIYIPRISDEQLDLVFAALLKDNPDIFFTGRLVSRRTFGLGLLCSIDYIFTKEEYEICKTELDAVCDEVISSISDPDDELQTEREIHDYVINNCSYDIADGEHIYSSAYGALINGEAACEGYSKAMQLLLDKAGIENHVICGKVKDENGNEGSHMWNVVKINGEFYHLDCTWNDTGENYLYFNVDDDEISKTHFDFQD